MVVCMHHKKGFSLLFFLLYLTLFSFISFFLCHIIVALIIPSFVSMRTSQSIMALHVASDLFVRDIRAGVDNWKVITPHELVWHTGDYDIGWCCAGKYVKRNVGIYNEGWKKKTTSIVAAGIIEGVFTPEKIKDQIIGVELKFVPISVPKKPIICYVAVKPKEIT